MSAKETTQELFELINETVGDIIDRGDLETLVEMETTLGDIKSLENTIHAACDTGNQEAVAEVLELRLDYFSL